jgi:bacterioferritin (cytochrome b1)
MTGNASFASDIDAIRKRAREHLEKGAITSNYGSEQDPTTRVILERVLAQEEGHVNDMHDLLVAHGAMQISAP